MLLTVSIGLLALPYILIVAVSVILAMLSGQADRKSIYNFLFYGDLVEPMVLQDVPVVDNVTTTDSMK